MSFTRTIVPSSLRRTMISSNSPAVSSRPLTVIGSSKSCPVGTGRAPILPAAACTFSCRIASMTSLGEIRMFAIRSGSIQILMAYFRPITRESLTPSIRRSTSAT